MNNNNTYEAGMRNVSVLQVSFKGLFPKIGALLCKVLSIPSHYFFPILAARIAQPGHKIRHGSREVVIGRSNVR